MKTGADHARNYRQRKAEKAAQTAQTLDRYRGALEEIAAAGPYGNPYAAKLTIIARQALTPTPHEMEGK